MRIKGFDYSLAQRPSPHICHTQFQRQVVGLFSQQLGVHVKAAEVGSLQTVFMFVMKRCSTCV